MKQLKLGRGSRAAFLIPAFAALPFAAHAGGFALQEQNASGLGNAYAGAGAVAEDASTIFYNPAGLSYLPGSQFVGGLNLIQPSAKFSDSGSVRSGTGIPIGTALRPLGGTGGEAGSLAYVPNLYFAMDLAPRWKAGIGLNAPFGQKTNYAPDWMGRFQALKSDIKTMNINPTISYKASDMVSVGIGANYQRIDAEFSQAVNYVAAVAAVSGAVAAAIPAANAEGTSTLKGNDGAWGWNAGMMFQLSPQTRLGLAYRSAIKYRVQGTVNFTNAPTTVSPAINAGFSTGNVYADVKLPDSATLALVHQLNDRWKLMADISWTGWSSIKNLTFYREGGSQLSSTPENFRDTWRVGVGATYKMNDQWSFKGGTAYDQTPVNRTDITPRLPDNNRIWLSMGAQYRISNAAAIDVGYTHLFLKDASINQNAGSTAGYGQLNGNYKLSVDILAAQFSYRF